MAGHDNGDGVARARGPDRTHRLRVADRDRDGRVAGGLPVADRAQASQDQTAESAREAEVHRQIEPLAEAGEVLVDLLRRYIEARGRVQNARTEVASQTLEDLRVVFAPVGDAHQSLRSRREQERADGGVDGAISDIEESSRLGLAD